MKEYTEREVKKLQDNLALIRQAGGWTTEQFGEMIGVTKQTISNLENNNTKLTKTQYIAIRAVLDYEMAENPKNDLLKTVMGMCFSEKGLSKEDSAKVKAFVTGSRKSGLDNAAIIGGIAALVGAALTSPALWGAAGAWIAAILYDRKD